MTSQLAVKIEPYLWVGRDLARNPELLKRTFVPLNLWGGNWISLLLKHYDGNLERALDPGSNEMREACRTLQQGRKGCYRAAGQISIESGQMEVTWRFQFLVSTYGVELDWRYLSEEESTRAYEDWKNGGPVTNVKLINNIYQYGEEQII